MPVFEIVEKENELFPKNHIRFQYKTTSVKTALKIKQNSSPAKIKLQRGKQMLSDRKFTIAEVAFAVGFSDPKYFSKCFKSEFGMSPKMYRELINSSELIKKANFDDELFLKQSIEKIEDRISDEGLDLDKFAFDMNVSKTTLYRRIKLITGLSPCEFIRTIRIRKAKQLLILTNLNITDIAFATGFCDSKYFCRCFKTEYGFTPSEYVELQTNSTEISTGCIYESFKAISLS